MTKLEFRLVPLLGVLAVMLVIVAFLVVGDPLSHHARGPEIRDAFDNEPRHQIGAFLFALAAVPLLFFAGLFRAVLTRLHPSGLLSANVALSGAVVAATGLIVQAMVHASLAEAANTAEVSGQALQSLNVLDGWSFYPLEFGLSSFALASGITLVRGHEFFAPFIAWAAVVLGVLGLLPIVGLFASMVSGIWVVIIGLVLSARSNDVDRLCSSAGPAAESPPAGP